MTKLAIVTGGTRGIGASIGISLQKAGYKVIANYLTEESLAEQFSKQHNIDIKKWDVSDYEGCVNAIKEIERKYQQNVSILVNNAGITRDKMLHKMSIEDWQTVIHINLSSCFNMCSAVINKMREQKYGRIINISSVNGKIGQAGQANYSAAKAGILGFTKALAKESANKNITVNSIAPGYINTEMVAKIAPDIIDNIVKQIPVGRLGKIEEVARVVLFLASEEAGFITGATIDVNGGYSMM